MVRYIEVTVAWCVFFAVIIGINSFLIWLLLVDLWWIVIPIVLFGIPAVICYSED